VVLKLSGIGRPIQTPHPDRGGGNGKWMRNG